MVKRKRTNEGPPMQQPQVSSSTYRGVTRHARTGRFEAHIWQSRKQLFLGSFASPERAALAFDLASIKLRARRNSKPPTNFPIDSYNKELDERASITQEALVQRLRAQSKQLHHHTPVPPVEPSLTVHHIAAIAAALDGPDAQHLGIFDSEIAAAMAYDRAAIARLGCQAHTNFDLSCYRAELGEEQHVLAESLGLLMTKPLPPGGRDAPGTVLHMDPLSLLGPPTVTMGPSLAPLLDGAGDESPSLQSAQAAASAAVWRQLSSDTPTSSLTRWMGLR